MRFFNHYVHMNRLYAVSCPHAQCSCSNFLIFVRFSFHLVLGLLSNVVQVSSKQLDTLNVVVLVELLVDRVGTVGRAPHGEQEDILASRLFEGKGNGDTI